MVQIKLFSDLCPAKFFDTLPKTVPAAHVSRCVAYAGYFSRWFRFSQIFPTALRRKPQEHEGRGYVALRRVASLLRRIPPSALNLRRSFAARAIRDIFITSAWMFFETIVIGWKQGWNDLNQLIKISDLNQMIFLPKKFQKIWFK